MIRGCRKTFIIIAIFFTIFLLQISSLEAIELDLTSAKDAVGNRFANKFCEAKDDGFSSEASSGIALNNTYFKFVSFSDDEKFIKDLWEYTLEEIMQNCGAYLTKTDETILIDFLKEEGEIASNRDLYLPH